MKHKKTRNLTLIQIKVLFKAFALVIMFSVPAAIAYAQGDQRGIVEVTSTYSVIPNVTYQRAGDVDLKLDIYRPRDVELSLIHI